MSRLSWVTVILVIAVCLSLLLIAAGKDRATFAAKKACERRTHVVCVYTQTGWQERK